MFLQICQWKNPSGLANAYAYDFKYTTAVKVGIVSRAPDTFTYHETVIGLEVASFLQTSPDQWNFSLDTGIFMGLKKNNLSVFSITVL